MADSEYIKTSLGDKELHPHQITAVCWMMERELDTDVPGGMLCDEMGLGKTMSTIGLIINRPVKSTLVLGPLAVLRQWVRAILPTGCAVYTMDKSKWKCEGGNPLKGRVFVTNYDKLIASPSAFASSYGRIICDEAHMLRNHKGKKFLKLRTLNRDAMWLLTGTPVVNGSYELATLMSLLKPSIRPGGTPTLAQAEDWMNTYAMCRTTSELREMLADLFPKDPVVYNHRIPFTTQDEADFYRGIQGRINDQIARIMEQDRPDMIMILQLLMRLRQISVHPQIYINSKRRQMKDYTRADWSSDSTKTEKIVQILNNESEKSHGYVIFCNFKDEMDIIAERLRRESCVGEIFLYHGGLSAEERSDLVIASEDAMRRVNTRGFYADEILKKALPTSRELNLDCLNIIEQFMGPRHVVMLAQIQCAGTGVNLQHLDRVIFTTPWWTAALMDQAAGRVLRLGQKNQVVIHHIALEEEDAESINIDDYMNARVEMKRTLCKQLLDAANHCVV